MYTDEINLHLGKEDHGPDEVFIPLLTRQLAVVFALAESGVIVNDLHSGNWKVIVADDGTLDPVIVDAGAAITFFEFSVITTAWRLSLGLMPPGLGISVLGRPDQAFSVSGDLYTRPSPAAGYLRQQIERQGWLEQSQTPEFDGSSEE